MRRQRARLTRTEREVFRLRTEGRDFSADTMRKAKERASEDLDAAIEREARWQWLREHGVRLTTDEPKEG